MNITYELATGIVLKLRKAGHEAYFVGGSVRDLLRGLKPVEYDVVTSAVPEEVRFLFPHTIPVGENFGVILVLEEAKVFEVATYRTEGGYADGRRPSQVRFSSLAEEDVRRRDFTVNGLLMDPVDGHIMDYVGGKADLEAKIIRTIGSPGERFLEDHLRMLRAVRFATNLDFSIEPDTLIAIKKNAQSIARISAERIRDEMTKILTGGNSRRGMELLADTGLLSVILPEVDALRGVPQPPAFHPEGDVWEHTMRMLSSFSAVQDFRSDTRLSWSILLHDIGKPETRTQDTSGIHFYGHSRRGEEIAMAILQRLRFSRADIETIASIIRNHMHFLNVMEMRPNRLKRFLRIPDFMLHLELHRLDCLASHGDLETYNFCKMKLSELSQEDLHPSRLLTGDDLVAMGFRPGPLFREILDAVEEAQLDGDLKTKEDALGFIKRRWRTTSYPK